MGHGEWGMEHGAIIADFEFRIANLGKSKEFSGEGLKTEFLSSCPLSTDF
jgi:hypothetical protein